MATPNSTLTPERQAEIDAAFASGPEAAAALLRNIQQETAPNPQSPVPVEADVEDPECLKIPDHLQPLADKCGATLYEASDLAEEIATAMYLESVRINARSVFVPGKDAALTHRKRDHLLVLAQMWNFIAVALENASYGFTDGSGWDVDELALNFLHNVERIRRDRLVVPVRDLPVKDGDFNEAAQLGLAYPHEARKDNAVA
jgi:hypothetical protein